MSAPIRYGGPVAYEVRIAGHLDPRWSSWFDGFVLKLGDDGTTVLSGEVADQAELHGLLARVRDLGVPLISVTAAAPGDRLDVEG